MIRTLLFDADGVLQHHGPFFDEDWIWPAEQHRELFRRIWAHPKYEGCLEGRGDFTGVCKAVLAESGWSACEADQYLDRWMRRGLEPDAIMLGWVQDLRAAGLACHLATNQEDVKAEFLERELGYDEAFDRLFVSCRLGAAKPERRFFEAVAAALPVPPQEVAFFDDKPENVQAAIDVGFIGRRFTDRESFARDVETLTGVTLAAAQGDPAKVRARLF
ncbi:HAD family hydrolase [Phenylobacterium terrae]|uniref:HAD family hydrolase n=1 Tax=Phenylobacterium terrae TaxID=2665495 RepID=A0ABW4N5A4_9CAUL